MIDPEFLKKLRCPETQQSLKLADESQVRLLNQRIAAGSVINRGGEKIGHSCEGALIREDGKYLYPIRENIPVMLIAESLPANLDRPAEATPVSANPQP